jgi:hypothetical protein
MSEVVLTAVIGWGEDSYAPMRPSRYGLNSIEPLARRIVPLLPLSDDPRRRDRRIFGKTVRGRSAPDGFHLEIIVDDNRPDGQWLLTEMRDGFDWFITPAVERRRLEALFITHAPTWSEARLRRNPLGLRPLTFLDRSPLPDRPRTILG